MQTAHEGSGNGGKRNEVRAYRLCLQSEPVSLATNPGLGHFPPLLQVPPQYLLHFSSSSSKIWSFSSSFGPFHQRNPPGGSSRCTRISASTSLCRVTPKPSFLLPQLSPHIPCTPSTKLDASEVHLTPDAPCTTQVLCSKLVILHTEPLMRA